ncbi:MAG: lysine 2,3-aminomutase [Proteobacteria bacterium]|nr:MAG: lysine 2,3-aminomutase [Pseudomonadota bacterium]
MSSTRIHQSPLTPFKTTQFLESLIQKDHSGALKRQFYPAPEENDINDGHEDPIGDQLKSPIPGLVHRYRNRVLLLTSSDCFALCRFCFRKTLLTKRKNIFLQPGHIARAIDYINEHHEIWEVILSGGDPLTRSDHDLQTIFTAIEAIDHVAIVRMHSRAPVVNPARITTRLTTIFETYAKPFYFVLHVNHPAEMASEVLRACSQLRKSGAILLSQTVLLKGVNNSAPVLADLLRTLVKNGIKPYYLHHCDRAWGNSHFRVELETGREIMADLRRSVSGICLPTYIFDIPHGYGKVPADRSYLNNTASGWQAIDQDGSQHILPII